MQRREFITLLGGGQSCGRLWRAHSSRPCPWLGFSTAPHLVHSRGSWLAFRDGLKDNGYVEGQNVAIEFRWAGGEYDELPALATDLIDRHVSVVAAIGPVASLAAKSATTTVPVVFTTNSRPC